MDVLGGGLSNVEASIVPSLGRALATLSNLPSPSVSASLHVRPSVHLRPSENGRPSVHVVPTVNVRPSENVQSNPSSLRPTALTPTTAATPLPPPILPSGHGSPILTAALRQKSAPTTNATPAAGPGLGPGPASVLSPPLSPNLAVTASGCTGSFTGGGPALGQGLGPTAGAHGLGLGLDQGSVGEGQSVSISGQYVKITVEDTGIGVPENLRTRLFQPFSKAQSKVMDSGGGDRLIDLCLLASLSDAVTHRLVLTHPLMC